MTTTLSSTTRTITFTQLRSGAWGLRSTAELSPGEIVTVTKKNGETKSATVGNRVWNGNGVWLYAIAIERSSRPTRRSYGRRYGSGGGSAAPVSGYSSWCTDNDSCGCYDCAS